MIKELSKICPKKVFLKSITGQAAVFLREYQT